MRQGAVRLGEAKVKSDPTLKRWYKTINKRFFDNQLTNNTCVRWANEEDNEEEDRCEEKYRGWADKAQDATHKYVIVLSRDLKKDAFLRYNTLVHEMIHLATELKDDHGKVFSEWHEHLTEKGLFKKGVFRKGWTLF